MDSTHRRRDRLSATSGFSNATSPSPCILNVHSFSTVCRAEYPLSWPVSQLTSDITSPASKLGALLSSHVTDITVYHRPGGPVTHDYLILCIRPEDHYAFGGLGRIWARCERNPGPIPGGATRLSRDAAPAVDTVKFSVDRPKLKAEDDVPIMMWSYDILTFEHVADLLGIIHDVSPHYGLASHNCWWFAAVIAHALEWVASDWTIKPSRDWGKKAIQALGKSTQEAPQLVATQFAHRWLVNGSTTLIPAARSNNTAIPTIQPLQEPLTVTSQAGIRYPAFDSSYAELSTPPPLPPRPPPAALIRPDMSASGTANGEFFEPPPPLPPRPRIMYPPLPAPIPASSFASRNLAYAHQTASQDRQPLSQPTANAAYELSFYPAFTSGSELQRRLAFLPQPSINAMAVKPPEHPLQAPPSPPPRPPEPEPPELPRETDSVPSSSPPPYDLLDGTTLSDDEVAYIAAQDEKILLASRHSLEGQHTSEPISDTVPVKNDLDPSSREAVPQSESPEPQSAEAYKRATKWREFTSALDSLNEFAETPGPSWFLANSTTDLASTHARISILMDFLREAFPSDEDDDIVALRSQVWQLIEVTNAQVAEIECLHQEIQALRSHSVEAASSLVAPVVRLDRSAPSLPSSRTEPIQTESERSVVEPSLPKLIDSAQGTSARPHPTELPPANTFRCSVSGPSLSTPTVNTRRLILDEVRQPTERPSGGHIVKAVNDRLDELTDDSSVRVSAISYSRRGRPIITTCKNVSADRLVPFADVIYTTIFGQTPRQEVHAYPDLSRRRVKSNGVPARLTDGREVKPSGIPARRRPGTKAKGGGKCVIPESALACPPTWLVPLERPNSTKARSAAVISIVSAEDALRCCAPESLPVFGKWCGTTSYTEFPPLTSQRNARSAKSPGPGHQVHPRIPLQSGSPVMQSFKGQDRARRGPPSGITHGGRRSNPRSSNSHCPAQAWSQHSRAPPHFLVHDRRWS